MAKIYDDGGNIIGEVCGRCYDEDISNGMTEEQIVAAHDGGGMDRYVWGVYAGHYCDKHFKKAGFVDDSKVKFDPDYAGESMEEDY